MRVLLVPHNVKLYIFLTILFAGIFSLGVHTASAAELFISPSDGSYAVGDTVTVDVEVDPQSESIRAVEAILAFDNIKFEVEDISKDDSVFTLWTTDPLFSNTTGTIEFGGASQAPFSATSHLVSVTLRAIAGGTGRITVSKASVQAADSEGTEVESTSLHASYTLIGDAVPVASSEAATMEESSLLPVVRSATYEDPEKWYATKTGIFTWEVPASVTKLALEISDSTSSEPMAVYNPPITEFALTPEIVGEGVQYLVMQFKDDTEWQDILRRKIQIDTVSPEPFIINIVRDDAQVSFPRIVFEAQDVTSGIEKYEIIVPGYETHTITADEARGGYLLESLPDGTYTVKVIAYDRAGNIRESYTTVPVTAGWINPAGEKGGSLLSYLTGKNVLILFLIAIIAAQYMHLLNERQANEYMEEKLQKETQEVQEQMEKIFSALRDEIFDQINMISKHEKLTKKERDAVQGLNQALEVSETLIEKEIGDVSKILEKKKTRSRKPRTEIQDTPVAPK